MNSTLDALDLTGLAAALDRWGFVLVALRAIDWSYSPPLPQGARWVADVKRGDDPDVLVLTDAGWGHVPL